MDRRKPGQSKFTTQRKESDKVEILSGVFEGKTTGTPISLIIFNEDQRSKDYGEIKDKFRPGHADYTYSKKYGFRDYRGAGRSSARETVARVAGGAVAKKVLKDMINLQIFGYVSQIGEHKANKISKKDIENELRITKSDLIEYYSLRSEEVLSIKSISNPVTIRFKSNV